MRCQTVNRLIEAPKFLKEFNYEKNIGIEPEDITYATNYKIWWKCEKGHEWQALYLSRSKKNSGCPYCAGKKAIEGKNDLGTLYPELILEWDYDKNEKQPSEYLTVSGKKVYWKCKEGHEWEAVIHTRTKRGLKCPYCSHNRALPGVSDLRTKRPDLAEEWDYEKNTGTEIGTIGEFSSTIVWWKCSKGHSFKTSIQKRTSRGDGCPFCSGHRAIPGETDLKTLFPEIAMKWNYEKNHTIPSNYTGHSSAKVWWKCEKGHEWTKSINQQVLHNICPYCSGMRVTEGINDLLTTHPEYESIWNYSKNNESPQKIKHNSHKKVWWKCKEGHEWQAYIGNIDKGRGCPYCAGKKAIEGENDLATLFPMIADEWNYSKNDKSPVKYLPRSNRVVWWKCNNGHEWRTSIVNRVNYGTGCPFCNNSVGED